MNNNSPNQQNSKSSIVSLVSDARPSVLAIACYHSTNSEKFSLICKTKSIIDAKKRGSLVFLFYGKPSYTLKSSGSIINEVSIVFDPLNVPNLKAALPFDSGGLTSGRYTKYFNGIPPRNDISYILRFFEMSPSFEFIRKFITFFFKSNDNYLSNRFTDFSGGRAMDELIYSWKNMVASTASTLDLDPPANTVELQALSPLTVDENSVFRIFMPLGYLDKIDVLELLSETGITLAKIETYEDELLADKNSLWNALLDLSKSANTAIADGPAT